MAKNVKSSARFAAMAKEATTLCELMQGKTKVDTEELLDKEITITGFDFIELKDGKTDELKRFAVCTFAEDEGAFFFGGTVLTKICDRWAKDFDGDAEAASEALAEEGGCVIKMTEGKTKNGRHITNVDII